MESSEDTKNISASMIIEVLGRPPEHLVETLKEIIEKIKLEPNIKVTDSRINESCPLKDNPDFCTNFAEVDLKVEEISDLIMIMFKYMPAHVEVISPEKISLSNSSWSEALSELIRKLHGYDEVARMIEMEKKILENKLRALLEEKGEKKKTETEKSNSSESKSEKKRKKKE